MCSIGLHVGQMRWLLYLLVIVPCTLSLDNGLALTPPMGWLAWERFRCNVDCKNDPDNCISERLFQTMADLVVSEGYAAVGYQYINVDDCWLAIMRNSADELQPDPERFPNGIPHLSSYIHSKGLKFGIYETLGTRTCEGYPGTFGVHLKPDAMTFASWEVDYVKFDGCFTDPTTLDRGYIEFGEHLNSTGRPMVYTCGWPYYQTVFGIWPDFPTIIKHCHVWRNYHDIQDSWESVASIIDYFGNEQDKIAQFAGPGHFNDPDMLIIGNFGLSYEQSKAQMAIWAILAAPLLMSVDLRTIRPEYKAILQNEKIIAVDQDPLGIQGRRLYKAYPLSSVPKEALHCGLQKYVCTADDCCISANCWLLDPDRQYKRNMLLLSEYSSRMRTGMEIWSRPIGPKHGTHFSFAIVFLNKRTGGKPDRVVIMLHDLSMNAPNGYRVVDLYDGTDYGVMKSDSKVNVWVNPTGVVMLRAIVQSTNVEGQESSFLLYSARTSLIADKWSYKTLLLLGLFVFVVFYFCGWGIFKLSKFGLIRLWVYLFKQKKPLISHI